MLLVMLISWIVFGFVVGLIARAIAPGPQAMGFVGTTLLGIAGSFVGGIVGNLLYGGPVLAAHPSGWIGSIIGALIVMALVGFMARRAPA
jgi:uncharacterized membrane protein YeaQ/YmgE (transglycosylase-associated protein family)